MSTDAAGLGDGRVQCEKCGRLFYPAGLGPHRARCTGARPIITRCGIGGCTRHAGHPGSHRRPAGAAARAGAGGADDEGDLDPTPIEPAYEEQLDEADEAVAESAGELHGQRKHRPPGKLDRWVRPQKAVEPSTASNADALIAAVTEICTSLGIQRLDRPAQGDRLLVNPVNGRMVCLTDSGHVRYVDVRMVEA